MHTTWISTLLLGFSSWGLINANHNKLSYASDCVSTSIIASDGTPVGSEVTYNNVTIYVSKTQGTPKAAVLYLTDVFGIQLAQNKLLADSFARAGYLTIAPDMFNGTPAPSDINVPSFNTTAFLNAHGPNVTDPIIYLALKYLHETYPDINRVAATGYCFGGRYAFRVAKASGGADVAFAAHPSLLSDDEILAITHPASVAAAETDSLMPPERRTQIEALLLQSGQPYSFSLYSGTQHGFGVRANMSDPKQRFGKESAFLQAVRWFDYWTANATSS